MEANQPITSATKMEAAPTTTQPSATKMSVDLPESERAMVGQQEEVLRLRGGYIGYGFELLMMLIQGVTVKNGVVAVVVRCNLSALKVYPGYSNG